MNIFIWCIIKIHIPYEAQYPKIPVHPEQKFWLALILQNKTEFRDSLNCLAKFTEKDSTTFL